MTKLLTLPLKERPNMLQRKHISPCITISSLLTPPREHEGQNVDQPIN